jgi:hypothetical protein
MNLAIIEHGTMGRLIEQLVPDSRQIPRELHFLAGN